MNPLITLEKSQLNQWIEAAKQQAKTGKIPDYIPLLQAANPDWLSLQIIAQSGDDIFAYGEQNISFPMMSIIKPFLLLYLLSIFGQDFIFNRVGKEPSKYPFNSPNHQFTAQGLPKNPMINSGAITLTSLMPGADSFTACENLRLWLNKYGKCELFFNDLMLQSVQSTPNQKNIEIADQLQKKGYLSNPEIVLATYQHICCLSGTIMDLARLGLLLLNSLDNFNIEDCNLVQELMLTCGLYEDSEEFALQVGFPTKSGVSGAILAIVPGQGAIACYSPPLNQKGNSIAGLFLIEKIANC